MKRYVWTAFLGGILIVFAITWQQTSIVWGLQNPTIPTRTPVPQPTNPPPKPTKPNNDGDDPTAVPTSTTEAQATATPTTLVTPVFTPVDGFIPTAEPCGDQPTIQTLNPTNIRQGPGTDYLIVGKLAFLEVRYIQGRAADSSWWLIGLDDGAAGWVADNVVTVHGFIGNVPIVTPPAINGKTPTPGVLWNPTTQPFCTVTPTATATETLVPSATPTSNNQTATTEISSSQSEIESEPILTATETISQTSTPILQPTQTAVSPPTLMPTNQPDQPQVIKADTNLTAAFLDDSQRSTIDFILSVSGILLIAAIFFVFIKRGKNTEIDG